MPTKKPSRPVKKAARTSTTRKSANARTASVRKQTKPAASPVKVRTQASKGASRPVARTPARNAPRQKVRKTAPAAPAPKPAVSKPVAGARAAAAQDHNASSVKFDPRPMFVRASVEEESDIESGAPASLLAGPRNVTPYIAKRGEQYMSKEQLDHFAQILKNWKRDLMVEVDRTVLHMKDEAANFPDPNDRATQEEEFSLELRTRDRERKLIRKIDDAIKRIEDGSYGYCLETGEEIGIKRLEARPVATLSVEAQERRERREKQYGDRDDRYR